MDKNELIKYVNQGYSTWKLAEHFNTTQPNIRYWLNKFDLITNRKSHTLTNQKLCPKCKMVKSKSEFYKSTKSSSFCKTCIIQNNKLIRRQVKQQSVDYLGGKCSRCGYNKCLGALDFHHTNPSNKNNDYINFRLNFEKLKIELDKCILLCSNCHREEHYENII